MPISEADQNSIFDLSPHFVNCAIITTLSNGIVRIAFAEMYDNIGFKKRTAVIMGVEDFKRIYEVMGETINRQGQKPDAVLPNVSIPRDEAGSEVR